ncbi:sirohydrochlorin chelatase [Mycolicibacterium thermoresistibile]
MTSELVLVAHGTRNPHGLDTIGEIASAVAARVGAVRTAFVDVLGPNPREVLAEITGPAVVVPAFLASGYHVNTDLPARIDESGHGCVTATRALGPDPVLAAVMRTRLVEAGWSPGDAVVLAAAGSTEAMARRDLVRAADLLAALVGEVHLGFIAQTKRDQSGGLGAAPAVTDIVARLRRSRRRVFIASYLLAPGFFHTRLRDCGAHGVAEPLGADRDLVALLARRFTEPAWAGAHDSGLRR